MIRLIGSFFDWIRSFFWTREMEITVLGLQNAGKTTFVNVIASSPFYEDMRPTVGFNMKRVRKGNVVIKVWDLGGSPRFRGMWERYCRGVNAIVYIVDAADVEKLKEAKCELHLLLGKPQIAHVPILILGNKTDLPYAIEEKELIDRLELQCIENRKVCCYMISCKNRDNLHFTLQWLTAHAKKSN